MEKLDLKKTLKPLYNAKPTPSFIEIPAMNFLMVDGAGDPNTSKTYSDAIQALYSVAYTLKFTLKKELQIDYPVMALEGLWWSENMASFTTGTKDNWFWTMMISTPEFVTPQMVNSACQGASKKKSLPALNQVRFEPFTEGFSAQLMHTGPYNAEAANIQLLHNFIHAHGYSFDGLNQKHHEIYLSDPNRTAPEKMKTIIRQPVRK